MAALSLVLLVCYSMLIRTSSPQIYVVFCSDIMETFIRHSLDCMQFSNLGMLHCSRQLRELADKVQDERFWASQQPHYGTAAAKRLLQTAGEALPGISLPSVAGPQLPQFPTVYTQSISMLLRDVHVLSLHRVIIVCL